MKKKMILAVLAFILVGCGEAKEASTTPVKTSQEVVGTVEATPYAHIVSKIGQTPMLLEFGSTSCASCVEMGKLLYRAKQEYPQSAIYFIEVRKEAQAIRDYKIQMIPTQVYLDAQGSELDRHIGAITYEQLIAKLNVQNVLKDTNGK